MIYIPISLFAGLIFFLLALALLVVYLCREIGRVEADYLELAAAHEKGLRGSLDRAREQNDLIQKQNELIARQNQEIAVAAHVLKRTGDRL
jgi:hypothetical protein